MTIRTPGPLLLATALALSITAGSIRAQTATGTPKVGEPLEFTIDTIDDSFSSAEHRGEVIWVDFWASWCTPCIASFPWMNEMRERYADHGLAIIAVNLDEQAADRDDFLALRPAEFAIGSDPEGKLAERFGLKGMPSVYLIGRDGKLLGEHVGFRQRDTDRYEAAIVEALGR